MTAHEELAQLHEIILQMDKNDLQRIKVVDKLGNGAKIETFLVGPSDPEQPAMVIGWRIFERDKTVTSFNVPDWADTEIDVTTFE